ECARTREPEAACGSVVVAPPRARGLASRYADRSSGGRVRRREHEEREPLPGDPGGHAVDMAANERPPERSRAEAAAERVEDRRGPSSVLSIALTELGAVDRAVYEA